ncbi:MAG: serine/threonine-protein kinase [Myxococcota bacterium]|nr:serine/threonine-protein kinase [Myxococcota bacterium]
MLGLVEGRLDAGALVGIDDHLDTCASCREVVTHVAQSRSPVLERGVLLGRYVVGELLGAGAMGRVYSAWDPELDRRVAIKVLQDDAPGVRERLVREAQAMARLDHPNVVGVHEVGRSEHGVFVAMDLVDGETLRAWSNRERTWQALARVLADVARGLAAVHAAGVLHRDVKPDNVIVGSDGRARVGDFGLARSGPSPSARPDDLAIGTPKTAVAGTPVYMAPEVLRGGSATEASDQFSFGVTAYEAIAGTRPFDGATWSELARAIERAQIARLSVPTWLEMAIRRCLAVDPARRWASMTALADALDDGARRRRPTRWIAAAGGLAIAASAATYIVATRAPVAVGPSCDVGGAIEETWNPTVRAGLQINAPALAAIDRWALSWRTSRTSVCKAAAVEPAALIAARERCLERRRSELAALLDRVTRYGATPERFIDALAALPPSECTTLALGSADPLPLDPDRTRSLRRIERELPKVRAAIILGDVRPVASSVEMLVSAALESQHAPTIAELQLLQAETSRALSNLPLASTAARASVAAAERGHDDIGAARAWVERMTVAGDQRDLALAADFEPVADAAIDRAGNPPYLRARFHRIQGLMAFNRGRYDLARRYLDEARLRFVALAGEQSVEVAGVETSLGAVARAAGDLDAAEKHHQRAFEIDRALRGEAHPDLARDLHNLAGIERLRGKLDEALALYQRALLIEDAARGKASVESALTHNSIGLVHMERGEWKEAAAEITLARDAFHTAGHGDIAFAEHNLGIIRAAQRDHAAALAHFGIAAGAYERTIGSDAPGPLRLYLDRARVRLATGDVAGARADAAKARELGQRASLVWIVEDADRILARPGRTSTTVARDVAIDRPIPVNTTRPVLEPPVAPTLPPAPPNPPAPPPKRDVGVYGSSQGW